MTYTLESLSMATVSPKKEDADCWDSVRTRPDWFAPDRTSLPPCSSINDFGTILRVKAVGFYFNRNYSSYNNNNFEMSGSVDKNLKDFEALL